MRQTAQLLNEDGRVTEHECVRLELRGSGPCAAIYPIYRCTETKSERHFGYLCTRTSRGWLARMYPWAPLEYGVDDLDIGGLAA